MLYETIAPLLVWTVVSQFLPFTDTFPLTAQYNVYSHLPYIVQQKRRLLPLFLDLHSPEKVARHPRLSCRLRNLITLGSVDLRGPA